MTAFDPLWLDRMYNNRALVPEHGVYLKAWADDSAQVRATQPCHLNLPYGNGPQATLDVFEPAQPVPGGAPVLVDHGAGKSYLGFILYDLFMKQHASGSIIGIETRQELVEKSQALAADLAFSRMQFHHLTVQQACESKLIPDEVEIVTALHACDTATDDAIRFALQKNAQFIVLVPCCQAEVAEELRKQKSHSLSQKALAEIWRHPIHTREFGSMVTNVLRCLQLESHGYQVTVTELVGWEHSMKNELIIAKRQGAPRGNAQQRLLEILDTLNLQSLQQRFS